MRHVKAVALREACLKPVERGQASACLRLLNLDDVLYLRGGVGRYAVRVRVHAREGVAVVDLDLPNGHVVIGAFASAEFDTCGAATERALYHELWRAAVV